MWRIVFSRKMIAKTVPYIALFVPAFEYYSYRMAVVVIFYGGNASRLVGTYASGCVITQRHIRFIQNPNGMALLLAIRRKLMIIWLSAK
ncbi:hypothetical protein [uncultured Duncaniella sp.]|uniref:hypothetical protein n=1 Tax=uncultured Duncaniella sp. TaxID=2768039 RepID=UPI0025A94607|nr:hypothetical protein [uncultured Duncaniella sp.]